MIGPFQDEWSFLSNFCPVRILDDGIVYPTVEHAYQASKDQNPDGKKWIASLPTPGAAKRAGKHVVLSPDWFATWSRDKLATMEMLLRKKFAVPYLRAGLLATEDEELVEVNTWGDAFWGVCDGTGENHLGKLLMKIRKEIRDEEA